MGLLNWASRLSVQANAKPLSYVSVVYDQIYLQPAIRLGDVSKMANWIKIANTSDCPPGEARELFAHNRIVALFNVDGEYFALDGICPHQGGPLGKGTLTGCLVTCPWHGWQFNVRTGQHQTSETLQHAALSIRVEAEEVFVDLPG